jgi:hypothetical protein
LRQKFEDWWLTVVDLDKLKLALACTFKLNNVVDNILGANLFSRRAFWRTSLAASGLLVASLSFIGLLNHQMFAVQPWVNYRETAEAVEKYVPQLESNYVAIATKPSSTNLYPQLVVAQLPTTNDLSTTNTIATKELVEALESIKQTTKKYDTSAFAAIYSVCFLLILVFLNALLCFFSMVFSRLIMREIILAARPFSTIALLVTNFVLVINVASVFLLLITALSTPILWYFLPLIFGLSKQSFSIFILILFSGEIASWIFSSAALKLVTLIAMLPCVLVFGVCVFSGAAMIWRNAFHKCVSAVLLRCAEKGPLTIIVVTSALLASFIAAIGKCIHWSF